jgi:hypothetical protein
MDTFDVQGIAIEAPYDHAFRFVADPLRLLEWTHAHPAPLAPEDFAGRLRALLASEGVVTGGRPGSRHPAGAPPRPGGRGTPG